MARTKAAVRATYDRIAESYAKARERPWDEVVDFITDLSAGNLVLDVGCGHGRHARPLALTGHSVAGIDLSRNLLAIGKKTTSSAPEFRSIEWLGGDATALPFADGTFDAALCIAVLHHLPSREDRGLAVAEIRRVLRPGGEAFLSVWALDDPYLEKVLGGRPKKPDVEIPWRLPDGTSVPRPYHLFKEGELEGLIIESGLEGERFFRSAGNWFALAKAHG
jgi:ubiquinone/menaquinone biosynthesis C-methylase UbiE